VARSEWFTLVAIMALLALVAAYDEQRAVGPAHRRVEEADDRRAAGEKQPPQPTGRAEATD
jgi:hypothetical protein